MDAVLDQISSEIYQNSFAIIDNFISEDFRKGLLEEQTALLEAGKFKEAAVGSGDKKLVKPEIRSDEVLWMDQDALSPLQATYRQKIEMIKNILNQRCFLGLRSFEGHFARYPKGSFYKKHLDQFQQVSYRIITVILYLNQKWEKSDGGELRLYFPQEDGSELIKDVLPVGGRLVIFLSGEIPHEVLHTHKERISITGWLKNID